MSAETSQAKPSAGHDPTASKGQPSERASGRLRFGKERRVRKRTEFLHTQSTGMRVHTSHFVLIVARDSEAGHASRLGVTVTRKIGDAVRRNRVKRLVREAFRLEPTLLPDGIVLIVIAKDGAPTLGLADVQSEWRAVRPLLEKRVRQCLERPIVSAPKRP